MWPIMQSLSLHTCYLLYKCVVAKLGSKAGNFLSGNREIEGRDREIEGRDREIER